MKQIFGIGRFYLATSAIYDSSIRGTFMSPGYTFMLKIQYYKINSLVI